MRHIRTARLGLGAVVAVVGLVMGATPALAVNPAGVASLGSANFSKAGVVSTIPTIAQCAVGVGDGTEDSGAVSAAGVRFGGGTSVCTRTVIDPILNISVTKSESKGTNFELSALVSEGGPRIKISSYRVTCDATQIGTNASWQYAGLSGITGLPNPMPRNYLKPITKTDGTLLATAKFNEVTLPDPNDGSIALVMLRITFAQASGYAGEVVVGSTACSPTP